uniref:Endonuclease V n=1 Tax=Sphaeramia orbicularis TaxID=375764 RepID=A0A672YRZ0_9TELE
TELRARPHIESFSLVSEQQRLRQQVVEEDTEAWQRSPHLSGLERVGGVDLSFIKGDHVNACAQLVVLSYPHLEVSSGRGRTLTTSATFTIIEMTIIKNDYLLTLKLFIFFLAKQCKIYFLN